MIDIKQFDGKTITPKDDALLYEFLVILSGVFEGCGVTHLGANQLKVASGRGIVRGRIFVIEEETLLATLSSSGSLKGRLLVRVDVSNTELPIRFVTQASAALPALVQEDINRGGNIYELSLATYDVDTLHISNLVVVNNALVNSDGRYIPLSQKGATNGVATLTGGKVTGAQLPTGTTSVAGISQLSSAVNDDAEIKAATTKGVKTAYDVAAGAQSAAAAAQAAATAANNNANGRAPANHNQPASTITAGTFPGIVAAQSNSSYATRQVRSVIQLPEGSAFPTLYNGDDIHFYK